METNHEQIYLTRLLRDDPVTPHVERFLAKQSGEPFEESGATRDHYLAFAEQRLRQFASEQDERGAILDPYDGVERQFATACFAKAGAVLLSAGRCGDLGEAVRKAMDWASYCLGENKIPDDHADFTTHMLVRALQLLAPETAVERVQSWRTSLSRIVPEATYSQTERNFANLKSIRNWATYAMHGEMMRQREGLTDSAAFVDKYLAPQLTRFTPEGLYRDPNLPVAYDLAARQQLSGLLDAGYAGEHAPFLRAVLRRGARAMLFMQSTTGTVSCGGRSNQIVWNDLTFAHLCEREASHYYAAGDARMAGSFKRAARLALQATRTWTDDPAQFRLFKNRFDAKNRAGWELYAYYSPYSLYAAQIAASCYEAADERIAELPAPADTGGYVFHVPSFHRLYASSNGYHLVVDTAAQMGHDATGLVRLHKRGVAEETALSTGIAGMGDEVPWIFIRPRLLIPAPRLAAAIGPMWRDEHGAWDRLARYGRKKHEVFHELDENGQPLNGEKLDWRVSVEAVEEAASGLRLQVRYVADRNVRTAEFGSDGHGANAQTTYEKAMGDIQPRPGVGSAAEIVEEYRIGADCVTVAWSVKAAEGGDITAFGVGVPLLATNGAGEAAVSGDTRCVQVTHDRYRYTVRPVNGDAPLAYELLPGLMPNRNGHYRLAQWTSREARAIALHFELEALD
ncbi:MAG: hypothetical protein J7639_24985 [Paenibacillaceae bacterium]|nr:hypothetical protein [Paenibacillaceae bacterium]